MPAAEFGETGATDAANDVVVYFHRSKARSKPLDWTDTLRLDAFMPERAGRPVTAPVIRAQQSKRMGPGGGGFVPRQRPGTAVGAGPRWQALPGAADVSPPRLNHDANSMGAPARVMQSSWDGLPGAPQQAERHGFTPLDASFPQEDFITPTAPHRPTPRESGMVCHPRPPSSLSTLKCTRCTRYAPI